MDQVNLWRLYNAATAYGKRPSDFYQLETEIGKWALDEACLATGRKFENMLNEGKNPFSSLPAARGDEKIEYSPVPKRGMRTMKIPENGMW